MNYSASVLEGSRGFNKYLFKEILTDPNNIFNDKNQMIKKVYKEVHIQNFS